MELEPEAALRTLGRHRRRKGEMAMEGQCPDEETMQYEEEMTRLEGITRDLLTALKSIAEHGDKGSREVAQDAIAAAKKERPDA